MNNKCNLLISAMSSAKDLRLGLIFTKRAYFQKLKKCCLSNQISYMHFDPAVNPPFFNDFYLHISKKTKTPDTWYM